MKSALLVYKSKTGFTKKYADWIVEECPCEMLPLEKKKGTVLEGYEIIIYGAGMHAGHILGWKEFKKSVDLHKKKVIVFATGGAPYTEEIASKIKENNFTKSEADIPFFYFESGINYEKMGFADKTLMSIYSKILESKAGKSELEEGTSAALLSSYDHSKKENIKPLITFLKGLLSIS